MPGKSGHGDDGNTKRRLAKDPRSPKKEIKDVPRVSDDLSELDFSEANLSRTMQLPTPQELSRLRGGAEEGYRKAILPRTIFAAVTALGGTCTVKTQRKLSQSDMRFFRAEITIAFPPNNILIATGDDYLEEGAMRAAVLHTLAKMRAKGLLTFPGVPGEEEFPDEEDALLDIYNYAARYRCIPTITTREFKGFIDIAINMPEHGIDVEIRNAPVITHAESAAAREFKRQAELYHLSQGSNNVVVRDRHALSTSNAEDFLTFCRDSGETLGELDMGLEQHQPFWVAKPRFKNVHLHPHVKPTIRTRSRAHALKLGNLVAALSVVNVKPHLLDEFSRALRAGNGKYLAKLSPREVVLNLGVIQELNDIQSLEWPQSFNPGAQVDNDILRDIRPRRALTQDQLATKSSHLKKKMDEYKTCSDLESLRKARFDLPMAQYSARVRQIVKENVFCIIIGATGSGKTTQVPQILLDEAIENGTGASCNVVCTQPRRIAATSVARRVAGERAEQLQDTVGYHVRFDPKLPRPGGSILYCTTGILLQQLQHAPDEVFDHVSHLVIDEVHERDIIIDFLLIMLKHTMAARAAQGKKLPRVVLMSATIDPEQFAAYFRDCLPSEKTSDCPTLTVPGRTFPVQEHYLDDFLGTMRGKYGEPQLGLLRTDKDTLKYLRAEGSDIGGTPGNANTSTESVIDWKSQASTAGSEDAFYADSADDALVPLGLAAITIAHIAQTFESGAILVFLPGLDEIVGTEELLRTQSPLGVDFNDAQRFQIIQLHSSIQDSQKTVFDPVPEGCRKIILSTNIAETSVTIPDVRFVVDAGKSREKRYDQTRRITQLQCTWISKSNAKQRAGRAGRVQDGVYYALFTRSRRESMRAVGLPELVRSDLQETCLDIKVQSFKMPVADFLAGAMEPPQPSAVDTAMQNLISLGALTEEEELTPLGRVLAALPVHPTLGKMIVLGVIFRCLDPMIILGAAANERSFFLHPLEQRAAVDKIKKRFAGRSGSDHIMLLKAFSEARSVSADSDRNAFGFFRDQFISHGAFKNIDRTASEIVNILAETGLIENQDFETTLQYGGRRLNENSGSEALIKALLVAGLYPNFAVPITPRLFRTSAEKQTMIHPGSVNSEKVSTKKFFTFNSLSLSNTGGTTFLRESSSVTPLMALLFGGPLVQRGSVLEMDQWLPMAIKSTAPAPVFSPVDKNTHVADQIVFLRSLLDRMLASAFDDLASRTPLAENRMRAELAFRLARVLAREAGEELGGLRPGGDVRSGYERRRERVKERDGLAREATRMVMAASQGGASQSGAGNRTATDRPDEWF